MHLHTPRLRLFPWLVLTALFLGFQHLPLPAQAGEDEQPEAAPAEAPATETKQPAQLLVAGKLLMKSAKQDGVRVWAVTIQVGPVPYSLQIPADAIKGVRKEKGHYVVVRGSRAPEPDSADASEKGQPPVLLVCTADLEAQKRVPLVGIVRFAIDGKKKHYTLQAPTGMWRIDKRDARKFKAFHDLNVAVTGYQVTDGTYRALEGITAVVRSLRPGERNPQSAEAAIGTAWSGVLTATKVPSGIPGVKPGDFALAFKSDPTLKVTTGRLFDTYRINGLRSRAFRKKKRSAEIELTYDFGKGGSYPVNLTGTYSKDWKTFSGTWTSGFLGSGTFTLKTTSKQK